MGTRHKWSVHFPTMPQLTYFFIHLTSIILLVGVTFFSFSAKMEKRKPVLIISGILSLLALIGGFGLLAKIYGNHFPAWVGVKVVCWLGISALSGLAFRRREKAGLWAALAVLFVVIAVAMVVYKPTF
ncbi:hypothetical protein GALL_12650 [mine drainage metagenome]|uniref:Invasion gene expression up-regulator, SirB n=1 Tax=mine drainage metagenome TaxID=410659 RepID=A0A1J5TDA6_9ZZZZ